MIKYGKRENKRNEFILLLKGKEKVYRRKFKKILDIKNRKIKIYVFSSFIIFFLVLIFFIIVKNRKKNFFACFCAKARGENKYARELIPFYLNLGVEKFIFGDNNLNNTEKLSDVIEDYMKNGIVDIYEIFGSKIGQSEFGQKIYEKYKTKCKWFLFFDFDEYLEIHFENNKSLTLNQFLSNATFNKCEAILFNWLSYTDNDLIYYDNRTLLERFTKPNYKCKINMFVKSIVKGGLNKTIYYSNTSNHVPDKNLSICDSMGRLVTKYNNYSVFPPVFNYGFIKHFSTKSAEEYVQKIKRGANRNLPYVINERIQNYFFINKFSIEKMNFFNSKFNKTFKLKSNF